VRAIAHFFTQRTGEHGLGEALAISPELFFAVSAILLKMQKSGIAFALNRPWWNFFGDRWPTYRAPRTTCSRSSNARRLGVRHQLSAPSPTTPRSTGQATSLLLQTPSGNRYAQRLIPVAPWPG